MSERRETSPAVFVLRQPISSCFARQHKNSSCAHAPSNPQGSWSKSIPAAIHRSPKAQPMPGKKEVVDSIAALGKRLGRAPSQAEFISLSGISSYYVLQYFRSWNDAVRTARLRPYALNIRPEDRALMEDWGKAARRHHRAPPRHAY